MVAFLITGRKQIVHNPLTAVCCRWSKDKHLSPSLFRLLTAYCILCVRDTLHTQSLILVSVSVSGVLMRMCKMKMNNSAILATSVMNWNDTRSNGEWIWTIGFERSHFLWTPLLCKVTHNFPSHQSYVAFDFPALCVFLFFSLIWGVCELCSMYQYVCVCKTDCF